MTVDLVNECPETFRRIIESRKVQVGYMNDLEIVESLGNILMGILDGDRLNFPSAYEISVGQYAPEENHNRYCSDSKPSVKEIGEVV